MSTYFLPFLRSRPEAEDLWGTTGVCLSVTLAQGLFVWPITFVWPAYGLWLVCSTRFIHASSCLATKLYSHTGIGTEATALPLAEKGEPPNKSTLWLADADTVYRVYGLGSLRYCEGRASRYCHMWLADADTAREFTVLRRFVPCRIFTFLSHWKIVHQWYAYDKLFIKQVDLSKLVMY